MREIGETKVKVTRIKLTLMRPQYREAFRIRFRFFFLSKKDKPKQNKV